tara:strand:+ start:1133 stop:2947 length:1815 start_codon:yes stop_codon:yes gene_type:complete
MPAMWPTFIPNLAGDIAGQSFTKPGGAIVSYELPKVGVDQVPIFPPSADLIKSIKPGNPLNAALTTDPTAMVNAINLAPLSGRYDFGVNVAERYLEAVKGLAMTPFGATHTNNPAAEFILTQGYGLVFERLLKEGDIPLQDQKDKDGNITEMGKESHPDYADFCPDPVEEPDPIEEQKKLDKKFNKFIEDYKNDNEMSLSSFRFFEFPCLSGKETQSELESIFAARLLQQFENITNKNTKWEFYIWLACLGSENYSNSSGFGGNWTGLPYPNINSQARSDIENAGYNWQNLIDNVSSICIDAIHAVHPVEDTDTSTFFNTVVLKIRIQKDPIDSITLPFALECPLNKYKLQIPYDFEHSPPENPSQRPKILTSNVVATFSWYPNIRVGSFVANAEGVVTNAPKFTKTTNWVESNYKNSEWKNKWNKIPNAMSNARTPKAVTDISPTAGGTVWKFQRQQVVDAISAAEECDAAEADSDINFSWPGGDPYEEMAEITIAYWYACLIKPFAPTPSALPALIPAPLTGIYIPIYYGGKKRLANNLRKAWNTGKTFSVIPAPMPPALAVSTAVAAAYMLHLLEFKLLYLGGIPTPVGPVPMIGIVPVVF